MIIWLASYPRSGNTFLRLVIDRLYGRGSSTVYPVDGVLERLGDLVHAEDTGIPLADLRASSEVHFVKTHRRRTWDVAGDDGAVYVVRDGRDALVSFARQRTEEAPGRFAAELRALIDRNDGGTAGWGQNVLSWLAPDGSAAGSRTVLLRFDDLIRDPVASVEAAISRLAPGLTHRAEVSVPTFEELHRVDPGVLPPRAGRDPSRRAAGRAGGVVLVRRRQPTGDGAARARLTRWTEARPRRGGPDQSRAAAAATKASSMGSGRWWSNETTLVRSQ